MAVSNNTTNDRMSTFANLLAFMIYIYLMVTGVLEVGAKCLRYYEY